MNVEIPPVVQQFIPMAKGILLALLILIIGSWVSKLAEKAVRAGKPPTALGGTPLPTDCPAALRSLYEDAVRFRPDDRPTFATMVTRLRGMLTEFRAKGPTAVGCSGSGKADGKRKRK